MEKRQSTVPAYLHKVITRVEPQGGEGLNGGGQLAVFEGRQPLAHVARQGAQAAALWMIPPSLIAGQNQRQPLQAHRRSTLR